MPRRGRVRQAEFEA